jgi:glycerophosphoryl diester phosphodiesterase
MDDKPMFKNIPFVIAHRGARSLAPENTIAAARKAHELGSDMWELDVAVTADGELVLMHDSTLSRTCNASEVFPDRKPWNVWDFTLEEIQTLDCGSWFNHKDPFGEIKNGAVSPEEQKTYVGEQAPTLREALEFTRDRNWRVNVELKKQPNSHLSGIIIEKSVKLIEELGMDDGNQLVISSFDHDYLRHIRGLNTNIPLQALTSEKIGNLSEYLDEIGAQACNPKINTWSYRKMSEYEAEGIQFNVWTVNDELELKALINSGVTGIITDYPQKLIALLSNDDE